MQFWVVWRKGITVKQTETFLALPCTLNPRKIKQLTVSMQLSYSAGLLMAELPFTSLSIWLLVKPRCYTTSSLLFSTYARMVF